MGLDIVEMFIEVEERFGVSIPDKDAQLLTTPRKLIDYVANRVTAVAASQVCLSQRSFYAVRRAIVKRFSVNRNSVAPATELTTLIPEAARPFEWNALKQDLAVPFWPDLQRPAALAFALFGVTAAFGFVPVAVSLFYVELGWALSLALPATVAVGWLLGRLTYRCKKQFPEKYATAGQLSKLVTAHTPLPAVDFVPEKSREAAAVIIHEVICTNLGISRDKYTEDSRFVEDIGVE